MSELLAGLKQSPHIRPMFNIGGPFDIQTGRYYKGKHGESILNGGLSSITGICGRGNTFKSALMLFMFLRVMDRYAASIGSIYDTEMSLAVARLVELSRRLHNRMCMFDFEEDPSFGITDRTIYNGTEWFEWLKEALKVRSMMTKANMVETPFLNSLGECIKILMPFLVGVDSLSLFGAAVVAKMQDNKVGESERNMEAMRDGASKTQLIVELPTLTSRSGMYIIMTAHMGDEHQLDPYSPPQKKLSFLKGKVKLKNVPEKFTFLTNNCWYVMGSAVFQNQSTKAPEFPRNQTDDLKGDTDLMILSITNLRAKSGPTGMTFDVIVSQNDGIEIGLTEFYHIKQHGRYGLGGNDRNYYLELYPECSLSRTTIRGKLDNDAKLTRAMEITNEMCWINNIWKDLPEGLMCTPKELYEDLKAKGYDWNSILENTRGYWTFDNDNQPLQFLSTMDLLNMRAGTYHPYWMEAKV